MTDDPMTDEEANLLADEAERGYDLDQLRPRADDDYRPPSIADGTVAEGLILGLQLLIDEYGAAGVTATLQEMVNGRVPQEADDLDPSFRQPLEVDEAEYRELIDTVDAMADVVDVLLTGPGGLGGDAVRFDALNRWRTVRKP